jgi:hypothetical protein
MEKYHMGKGLRLAVLTFVLVGSPPCWYHTSVQKNQHYGEKNE